MSVIVSGIAIFSKELQPSKANPFIFITPSGIVTFLMLTQFSKALCPISFIEFPKLTFSRFLKSSKEHIPTLVTPFSIITLEILLAYGNHGVYFAPL